MSPVAAHARTLTHAGAVNSCTRLHANAADLNFPTNLRSWALCLPSTRPRLASYAPFN
jgi:hypothetical protein